ncbi:WAT1-related protein [Mucuna pruriens]|uniref:WAT1-related protein n=1 Tax=Mucuna pruriens TaxID=157652 RepID=A0A371HZQ8_MUCPR|nr:WAT1-related protein [Mucuna pruriens]
MDNLYNAEAIGNVKPVLFMIMVQTLYAVVNIMLKLVADDGMSLSVLIAYRFIFASAFIVPLALIFERLEKSNLGTLGGRAKLVGTLTGIGGAMILTFYKGRRLFVWSTHIDLLHHAASAHGAQSDSRLWGCMLAFGAALSYSLWLIIQTKMSEKFPWHYSIAALTSATASILSVIFALCTERDWSQWKLGWNMKLLTAASAGILASGVCYTLLAWCVHRKGPLFASAFSPLMLVIVSLASQLVLDECLSIGSLTGSVLIVGGLYMLLWGKSKDTRREQSEMVSSKGSSQCDPIHVTNLSLTCSQREHDKNIVASNVKPVLLMIVVQILYAVVNIMIKLVADDGMSLSVFNVYRFIFASAFLVPLALIFERGSLLQNVYVKSLALTSAVYVSAMLNIVPAVTYILSISLRLEKPNLGTPGGMAKLVGNLTGIGGAVILTFYKGRRLCLWSTHIELLHHAPSPHVAPTGSLLWGCLLAFGATLSYSFWLIIQTKMSIKFPWHYSIAALTSVSALILSIIYALCTERDWSRWKLGWNLRLLTAASTGILASGVCYILLAWCVRRKGPVFVSSFSPLMLVIVTLAGPLVLDECLTIGSLTGSVLIVSGLYMLLWGKSKETRREKSEMVSSKGSVQCEAIHNTHL